MKSKVKVMLSVVLVILVLAGVGVYAAGPGGNSEFSYASYAAVLRKHVDDQGMVSYAALNKDPAELDRFVQALAAVKPETYEEWDQQAKIAFWINAYNALTLKAIIDHYPIKAGLLSGLAYPQNSIRQIHGVSDKLRFPVMGRKMTLNQIEHETLRAKFDEPRIHVALVCAAMGCPRLRNEPFVGETLDAQLDDQAKGFMASPAKFRIDRDAGKVYLSSIFKWFGEDFRDKYAPKAGFERLDKTEQAVLNFISRYLSAEDQQYLAAGGYSVKYLDYDWSLNERRVTK